MPVIDFDRPDRFVAGTVGEPGARTFYLQASAGRRVTSVSLEKEQVQVLAERLGDILDQVAEGSDRPAAPLDNGPLTVPIEDEFRVATLSLAWNEIEHVVIIECHDTAVDAEEVQEAPGLAEVDPDRTILRVVITAPAAREFARRALALVAQGRPPCPFCGLPLEPTGHVCPRANGYRR